MIYYNVWMEIEAYDDETDEYEEMEVPVKLAVFDNLQDAIEYTESMGLRGV